MLASYTMIRYNGIQILSFVFTAPSAPTDVTALEISSTYAIISWAAPEFPNGIIRKYTVLLRGSDGDLISNTSTTEMTSNITDLSPFVQYWVFLFAETVETGESANISFITSEASKSTHTLISL